MKNIFFSLICLVSFSLFAQFSGPCDEIPELNQQILKALKPYLGKKIYRGECWDAPKLAMELTGATWDGLNVFGRAIDQKTECILPGDIIWLQKIETSSKTANGTYMESYEHHFVIVYSVKKPGELEILHQNNGYTGKKMGISTFRFADIVSKNGTITVYRPYK